MTDLLGADTDVLDRIAESLRVDARRMQDIRTRAERAVAELASGWTGLDLWHLTQQWEQEASPQLAGASTSLDACAAELRAQSTAQRGASSNGGGGWVSLPTWMAPGGALGTPLLSGPGDSAPGGPPPAKLTPPPTTSPTAPPNHGTPTDNASWWRSLSPGQQRLVLTDHPDWIGNRDGVPFTARDEANRALLSVNRTRLEAERQRLEAHPTFNPFEGTYYRDDLGLARVDDKLASVNAVEQVLARSGPRQLVFLDMSHERAQAAIARGDVDAADNVAVFVPGLSSTVNESLKGYDNEMDQLQRRAETENSRADPTRHLTTATVTWIGYQAPQMGWDLLGSNSVAAEHAAQAGAAQLVPFLRGIGAARDHDAHLSVLGHSYGSTTAGLALRQDTGVDDVVFFGSPGLGTSHLDDLSVPKGHAYLIEARWDPGADLGAFGIDPSHLDGIEHASAKESTVVDPNTGEIRHFTEVTGHTSYLEDGSTSQYNMSVVVAGVPDRRVFDRGEGLGDVLSWRLPGTYR